MGYTLVADCTPMTAGLKYSAIRVEAATVLALAQAAHVLERAVKQKLSIYSHPKDTPTTSPPGEPPAVISGTLRRSILVDIHHTPLVPYADIGPTVIYGRIQELGGRGHRNIVPPRPYMAPAIHMARAEMQAVFVAAWRAALR